jgi:hypothetical protein
MPRLFALDHNFPEPIVDALAEFQVEAELVRVDRINAHMPDLDDCNSFWPSTITRSRGTV